jgi:TolB-like protein/DNA-binding winged helix-turn-helix (wHTH) protein/Tfp pilus assembly protein PilF
VNLDGSAAFRIGAWRVNPALDEISRDGATVKLEPRTMRVLVCLAEHAGEVVSVNQLLDTVWKDLVVTQYSVYQAIAVLRRALGDNPKNPAYIANVARRGYRLIPPVDTEPMEPVSSAPAESSDETGKEAAGISPAHEVHSASLPAVELPMAVNHRWALRIGSTLLAALAFAAGLWWISLHPGHEHRADMSDAHVAGAHAPAGAPSVTFKPPPHSVAVLPFTNLSGDSKQEYFSDGISEELINALAQINDLKVIARTSSFSFKGKDADIGTIARQLNVAAILEGSVRRSGNTIRVTAQLINAVNGFHIWSQDYDRDLNNVLALQTDIATRVADQLQTKLLGDEAPRIELGGTRNAAAFDAYLQGSKAHVSGQDENDAQAAISAYTQAIKLDPTYALAFAGRSNSYSSYAEEYASGAMVREAFEKARADARQAIALAPELGEGYAALGHYFESGARDYARANEAYERAVALAPGNIQVLRASADFAISMGRIDAGLASARRGVALDPLNPRSYHLLGQGLYAARRYDEAASAFAEAISLDPQYREFYGVRGLSYYGLGSLQSARSSCETNADHWVSQWCLALVYAKLGRHADAESVLGKYRATVGDAGAYQYATIYAQWGDRAKALQWLEKAMRLRDSGLVYLKTDPLLDPLRSEPRFQAIERELGFPH